MKKGGLENLYISMTPAADEEIAKNPIELKRSFEAKLLSLQQRLCEGLSTGRVPLLN